MITGLIIYVIFGIVFYLYGLHSLKKYKQESETEKRIVFNFILMAFIWPAYVFKAIDILAKTGAYKQKDKK